MKMRNYLSDLFFRHDPIDVIYKNNFSQYDEYDAEARHIERQLELGIPFKTAIHDVFSFFFHAGVLIPKAEIVARIEAEYYNHISTHKA